MNTNRPRIRDALKRHKVRYLFIGKSGAILLGFPDTTQDVVLYVCRNVANGKALVAAVRDLGFDLTDEQAAEIERGKDFIQLKNGPFDLDLVFARTESNGLRMPGAVTSTSKTSLLVISMTLLPAKKQPVERGIANRFPGYEPFENTGCNRDEKNGPKRPESSEREIELLW